LVIRISRGELGLSRAQGGSLLHALEDLTPFSAHCMGRLWFRAKPSTQRW
jgi:hypothetical protein